MAAPLTQVRLKSRASGLGGGWEAFGYDARDLFISQGSGSLSAWDSSSHTLRWKQELLAAVRASPLVVGEQLVVPTEAGLLGLSRESGEVLWQAHPELSFVCAPVHHGELVWAGSRDGVLLGLLPDAGIVLESALFQQGFFSSPAISEGRLVWGEPGGMVTCFDCDSRKVLWRYRASHGVLACPTIFGDQVLVGTGGGDVLALSFDSGILQWQRRLPASITHALAATDDFVYVPAQDAHLYALDRSTGERRWQAFSDCRLQSPIVTQNSLLFGGSYTWSPERGAIFSYDFSGERLWREHAEGLQALFFIDATLVYAGAGGQLYEIQGKTEKPKPKPPPAPVVEAPAAPVQESAPAQASKPKPKPPPERAAPKARPDKAQDPARLALQELCDRSLSSREFAYRGGQSRRGESSRSGIHDLAGVRWQRRLQGGVFATPTLSPDGDLLVGTFDGVFYSIDPETGASHWEKQGSSSIWSSAAVVDDWVYYGDHNGNINGLERNTAMLSVTLRTDDRVISSPVVREGVLYVGSYDEFLYAFRLGEEMGLLWKFKTGGSVHASPAIWGDLLIFGSQDGYVYAIDRWTGALEWEFRTGGWVYSSPAVRDGVVYVGSDDHHFYVLDAESGGSLLWKHRTQDEVVCCPAVAHDAVYVGSRDNRLYAFDRTYGNLLWTFTADDYLYGSPVVTRDKVYFGSVDRHVYALDRTDGTLVWKFACPEYVWASPVVLDGRVIVADRGGNLYCLQDRKARK